MKKVLTLLLVISLVIGCATTQKESPIVSSFEGFKGKTHPIKDIVQEQGKAVVLVVTYDESGNALKLGSGFFVKSDGILVTNYHVIEGAYSADIKLTDGRVLNDMSVIDINSEWDIVILKVKGSDFSAVRIGNSDNVQTGERIVVIGNPEGLQNTVSDGLVSSVRKLEAIDYVFQISAPISMGSSGGPVYNMDGEVIGISTLMLERGQNLNFAVPIKFALPLIEKIGLRDLKVVTKERKEKAVNEYLNRQNNSSELSPEETIFEDALQYYKQANEKEDGMFMELLGTKNQGAIELLKKAIEIDPNYHAAHYVLGLSYKSMNELDIAEKELVIANSLKPLFSDGHRNLGEIYHKMSNLTKAISEYETALKLKPDDTYSLFLLGMAYRDKKEYKNAIDHFKLANELVETGYPSALFEMAMTYSEMNEFGNALNILKQIDGLYNQYEGLDNGIKLYQSFYNVNKKDAIYLQNYAYLYFLNNDYENSIKYFSDAIIVDKSKFKCNYELGKSFLLAFEDEKAPEYLEKAVKDDPNNYNAFMALGEAYNYISTPDYDKVISAYEKAIQLKPNDAVAYYEISNGFYYGKNDLKKAKEYVLRAILLSDKYALAIQLLGDIYKHEKNFEEALKEYEKALEIYSAHNYRDYNVAMIKIRMGEVHEELNLYDEALKNYQEAYGKLALDRFQDNIARVHLKQERYSEAISIYKKQLDKKPENSSTHFNLAYAYSLNSQIKEAIEEYHKVIELEPNSSSAHYNLGFAYSRLGRDDDTEKILYHLKKYLELTKDIEGEKESRKFAKSQIAIKEFPLKLKKLKGRRDYVGAIASLLVMGLNYNEGNNQFIEGIKNTKYEDYKNIVGSDIFVSEATFDSIREDIKKVKADDPNIQEVIEYFEKAILFRLEGIKLISQGLYMPQKDYKGEYEKGTAKIKVADGYFIKTLKSLQQVMKVYKDSFSEDEVELLSAEINYYSTKYEK